MVYEETSTLFEKGFKPETCIKGVDHLKCDEGVGIPQFSLWFGPSGWSATRASFSRRRCIRKVLFIEPYYIPSCGWPIFLGHEVVWFLVCFLISRLFRFFLFSFLPSLLSPWWELVTTWLLPEEIEHEFFPLKFNATAFKYKIHPVEVDL